MDLQVGGHQCFHCLTWKRRVDSGVRMSYVMVCLHLIHPSYHVLCFGLGFLKYIYCNKICWPMQMLKIWNLPALAKWVLLITLRQVLAYLSLFLQTFQCASNFPFCIVLALCFSFRDSLNPMDSSYSITKFLSIWVTFS